MSGTYILISIICQTLSYLSLSLSFDFCDSVWSLKEKDEECGELVAKLAKLPLSQPLVGSKQRKQKLPTKVIKENKELTRLANLVYFEWDVCRRYFSHLDFIPQRPHSHAYGEDQGYRYLVMKRLDFDLITVGRSSYIYICVTDILIIKVQYCVFRIAGGGRGEDRGW